MAKKTKAKKRKVKIQDEAPTEKSTEKVKIQDEAPTEKSTEAVGSGTKPPRGILKKRREKRRQKKEDAELNEVTVKRFVDRVDIHGAQHIMGAATWVERLVWLTLVLLGLSMLVYNLYNLTMNYKANPINTAQSVVNTEGLEYPVLTICSYGTGLRNGTSEQGSVNAESKKAHAHMDLYEKAFGAFMMPFGHQDPTALLNSIRADVKNATNDCTGDKCETLRQHIEKASILQKDFIKSCTFGTSPCKDITPFFNELTLHQCFTIRPPEEKVPLQDILTGAGSGFEVTLDLSTEAEPFDLDDFKPKAVGITVQLSMKNADPLAEPNLKLPVGSSYSVEMTLEHMLMVNISGSNKDQTCFPGDKILEFYNYTYSRKGCLYDIINQLTYTVCGCYRFNVRDPHASKKLCDLGSMFKCAELMAEKHRRSKTESDARHDIATWNETVLGDAENCHHICLQHTFKPVVTSMPLASQRYTNWYEHVYEESNTRTTNVTTSKPNNDTTNATASNQNQSITSPTQKMNASTAESNTQLKNRTSTATSSTKTTAKSTIATSTTKSTEKSNSSANETAKNEPSNLQMNIHTAAEGQTEKPKVKPAEDPHYLNQKVIKVSVHYTSTDFMRIEQSKAATFSKIVSDIGGQLGIWLGASLITLTQLLVLALLAVGGLAFGKVRDTVIPGQSQDSIPPQDVPKTDQTSNISV